MELIINIKPQFSLKADKNLLQRAITNLIDNAIKYSKAEKIICSADTKHIIIEDNGIGIPKKQLDLIFERFYRIEKSRSRKTGGLGLGLSIVKEIIEAHGWEISAQKRKKNKGVKFIIKIPK